MKLPPAKLKENAAGPPRRAVSLRSAGKAPAAPPSRPRPATKAAVKSKLYSHVQAKVTTNRPPSPALIPDRPKAKAAGSTTRPPFGSSLGMKRPAGSTIGTAQSLRRVQSPNTIRKLAPPKKVATSATAAKAIKQAATPSSRLVQPKTAPSRPTTSRPPSRVSKPTPARTLGSNTTVLSTPLPPAAEASAIANSPCLLPPTPLAHQIAEASLRATIGNLQAQLGAVRSELAATRRAAPARFTSSRIDQAVQWEPPLPIAFDTLTDPTTADSPSTTALLALETALAAERDLRLRTARDIALLRAELETSSVAAAERERGLEAAADTRIRAADAEWRALLEETIAVMEAECRRGVRAAVAKTLIAQKATGQWRRRAESAEALLKWYQAGAKFGGAAVIGAEAGAGASAATGATAAAGGGGAAEEVTEARRRQTWGGIEAMVAIGRARACQPTTASDSARLPGIPEDAMLVDHARSSAAGPPSIKVPENRRQTIS
ncbi:hypothetical protein H9P43_000350 [Blastocladiella emersonii ATCC 22665]|nr:hypothetical protein H9P43_000350 [Blastocladiella emersonii ATCC 22665]